MSSKLAVPANITLVPLPPKCPELNPTENVWQFLRDNWLSNRIFKARARMCPVYVAGLIGAGDRKSVQPMAARDGEVGYDQLHHFIASGVWEAAPLEKAASSDRMVRRPPAATPNASKLLLLGNSATRSAATVLAGISAVGSSGSAVISSVSRCVAAAFGIRPRLAASCQGSTPSLASAEITLRVVPFRSSPIDAQRNLSNSGPMRGASAACVMSSADSLFSRANPRRWQGDV